MSTLKDMADEYLQNVAVIEHRIAELKTLESRTSSYSEQIRLRRRIQKLYMMAEEGRETAFKLQHYYDKPEERAYVRKAEQPKKRKRVKFGQSGYGPPTPALATRSRNLHAAPVSGIRTQLSGRNAGV